MTGQAITFDFHNTIASCPEWFELEVNRLPSAFLRGWSATRQAALDATLLGEADSRYRDLRRDIIGHGNELTAEASLELIFAGMGIDVPEADIAPGVEHLMREALRGATPVPGAVETVLSIQRAGVPLGVVSSAVYHPFLEWTLESFGVLHAFQIVITSASAGFYKSRPELYWHAAESLSAAPARMIHVGDSLRFDVAGASRAGMGTVWLNYDGASAAEDSIVPDLSLVTLEGASQPILNLLDSRAALGNGNRA
jgi:FMN phosphatase YigB (HAD superfamily)